MNMSEIRVKTRYLNNELFPAVNVKCHDYKDWPVQEELHCSEKAAEKASEFAFDEACERFWREAPELARRFFGEKTKIEQTGRSGGWLVVKGLKDLSNWSASDLSKWRRFEKAVLDEIDYLASWRQAKESIEANKWHLDGAEKFNFFETAEGEIVCIAELKAKAKAAGFGAIIRE